MKEILCVSLKTLYTRNGKRAMPELPEVHTIATDLSKYLVDSEIQSVEVKNDFKTNLNQKEFKKNLINKKVLCVSRISKNIVLELSDKVFLVFHLAMTGRLLIRKPDHLSDRWERIIITLSKNGKIAEARVLLSNAKEIFAEAILHRGSTLRDGMFVDAFGRYGTHQNFLRVYNQKNCKNCGTKIKFEKINSRSTYFCPSCQIL